MDLIIVTYNLNFDWSCERNSIIKGSVMYMHIVDAMLRTGMPAPIGTSYGLPPVFAGGVPTTTMVAPVTIAPVTSPPVTDAPVTSSPVPNPPVSACHKVACGKVGRCSETPPTCAAKTEKHEVRCCSDTEKMSGANSAWTWRWG